MNNVVQSSVSSFCPSKAALRDFLSLWTQLPSSVRESAIGRRLELRAAYLAMHSGAFPCGSSESIFWLSRLRSLSLHLRKSPGG